MIPLPPLETNAEPVAAIPPITIRHLLYWTAGAALALWLCYGNEPPSPKNLLGFLLVSSSVTYCIVAGGAIGFLALNIERAIRHQTLALSQPGAKYVALLGVTMLAALIKTRWMSWNWAIAEQNGLTSADPFWMDAAGGVAVGCFGAAFFTFGIFWVQSFWWRLAVASMALDSADSAYINYRLLEPTSIAAAGPVGDVIDGCVFLLRLAPIIAVTASMIGDRWTKTTRDWTHYFGVLLCILLTIEFLLVQIPLAIRQLLVA